MTQQTIFMSHSSKDREFTSGLAQRLQEAGFRCWVDVDDLPDGSTWVDEIEKAVINCSALLVIASENSHSSKWVKRETLLAMDLHKPIFVARIDDTPLPFHLIDLQYSDFRKRPEAAIKKLITALQKAAQSESSEQEKPVPEPNRPKFFKYMEQLPDGAENARISQQLFQIAKSLALVVTYSGRSEPAMHANLEVDAGGLIVFSVRAYLKQPAVEVPLQYLMNFPPYDARDKRLQLLEELNEFVFQPFDESRADRRPNIALIALRGDDALKNFGYIIYKIVDTLRA